VFKERIPGRTTVRSHVVTAAMAMASLFLPIAGILDPIVLKAAPAQSGDGSQDSGTQQLIRITQPKFEQTYSKELHVKVRLRQDADPATFEAFLNGANITNLFNPTGACAAGVGCHEQAWVPESDLVDGTNVLLTNVTATDGAAGVARVKLEWEGGGTTNSGPVQRLIPGVAVNALKFTGGDPNNLNNFQIVIGPGPNFPARVYTAAHLTCSAGIHSVQVLVLQDKTLEPDRTVPGNTGQACFGDADSLANFLKILPAGDLVIANSFFGAMPRLNTTAIGGTDFSTKPEVTPLYYNVIGVAGASAGQAYESYQPINPGIADISPLVGSLMLDTEQNYFFVPSEYREFNVIPNDPAFPNTPTSTIVYSGESYRVSLPSGVSGGFVFFLIDRQTGYVQSNNLIDFFPTNSSDPTQSAKAIQDLTNVLTSSSPYYLIVMTTVGVPFSSPSQVNDALWRAINSRGGNGYMMAKLTPPADGSPIPTYTLISSTDPNYPMSEVIENSNLWTIEQQSGAVHLLLGRNRQNQWSVHAGMPFPTSLLHFAWTQVGFQQPSDWPAWTVAQQAAYADLTSAKNRYPSIGRALGCNQAGNPCQPIRSYYDGGIGGTGIPPAVLSVDYNSLVYQPNSDYSQQDFDTVRMQLGIEQGYLRNVYTLYGLFAQLANSSEGTIQQQFRKAVGQIDEGLRQNNEARAAKLDDIEKAAMVASLASNIPYVGTTFSAVNAALEAVMYFTPVDAGIPGDYTLKVKQILDEEGPFGKDVAKGILTLFTSIVNDWGKLETIGGGYGGQQAPWYMCVTCRDSNVPQAAIPLAALGAKRSFYSLLLPTVYTVRADSSTENDATQIPHWYIQYYAKPPCTRYRPYSNAPSDAWWSYPNITTAGERDFRILSEIKEDRAPLAYGYVILYYPSGSLLTDLFSAPSISGGSLGGGAGFIQDRMISGMGPRSLVPVTPGVGNACHP